MKNMYEIRSMLENELMTAADHGSLSVDKLKVIDMITHSIKSIDTILAMQNSGYDRGNSYRYGMDRRYSRDDGRSEMMDRLNDMLRTANTDKEREAIRRCIDQMA